ncbi:phasin family protein [Spongiibacter marinus]|uniref:phasin family protein n=2 Tax=Spongiibacter marinus TaxID=354246 RepID=UPI0019618307|nr:phasin family protein [Spongiibacter marinus]MBM7421964.1 polyhydroxyalkanoate synthesis regulator phasin [Spongiibacter marinus]MEE2653590.1 phasin family protein [Pseudomonadota bacterium]
MSNDSKKSLKDVSSQASELAKSIWLAGLGAYGRAYDEAQEVYEKASKDSPRLFKELVDKGNKLEVQAREKLGEASNIGKTISIEERISKMRASLGFGHTASADDLERLEKKLDALSKKVDALSKASKAPAKAAPAKKAAAKKTAAKKAPAKKAAAKKAAE